MECLQFEDLISDYLECGLARPVRRTFCEHLLVCRPCHQTFNDVREVLDACYAMRESSTIGTVGTVAAFAEVEQRIINATTAGEMLSCRTLDALISDYFEGNIENTYETIFNEHFAVCGDCRRLVKGVRESLEEPEKVEVPTQLYDRIFAATVGLRRIA
jgi:predicted anti-sigma-YlaC factor YlaD